MGNEDVSASAFLSGELTIECTIITCTEGGGERGCECICVPLRGANHRVYCNHLYRGGVGNEDVSASAHLEQWLSDRRVCLKPLLERPFHSS